MDERAKTADPVTAGLEAFSILIVDDETGICDFLSRALAKHYSHVVIAHSTEQAQQRLQQHHFDLTIVDICLPGQSGVEWVRSQQQEPGSRELIFMTGFAELENAVEAVRLGASDFILKPFRLEQMLSAVRRCAERVRLSRENYVLHRRLQRSEQNSTLIGDSPQLQQLRALIERVAPMPSAVLVQGETGTGKELVAAALHQLSGRKGPFVPVNCGAIAAELIESELFGHTKGAFTGAGNARQGLFSYADGGTLFLDEISEMPLPLQAKLLRVLQEGKSRPVGSEQEQSLDVRVVAACNQPLELAVEQGSFRQDLFYRLNVLPIELPPLRARIEDIVPLVHHLNHQLAQELGMAELPLGHQDIVRLQDYAWPGNVRELRNLLERCMLLGCLPQQLLTKDSFEAAEGYPLSWSLADVELRHIERVLQQHQGNKSRAADQLGISRKTLDRKLQPHVS